METLSSSFLATNPQFLNSSSFTTTNQKRPRKSTTITSNLNNPTPQKHKKPKPSLLSTIFNKLDHCICKYFDSPLPPTLDPTHVLVGNFLPVDELPPTACQAVGNPLPSCLDGAYIRNGPNPQFIPNGPYHYFEGDGMLHVIKISKGKATFCSRYVKTHKYEVEGEAGHPFVPSIFSAFGGGGVASVARMVLTCARIITRQFSPVTRGFGAANTSVLVIGGRLYALCESDLPYEVKVTEDGDLLTLRRHDFQASEPFFRMTAHPKVDQVTGEAFAYRYNIRRPFFTLFRINSEGKKEKDVPIHSIERLTAMHDFAVTKKYVIIPDVQIVVDPLRIFGGGSPVGIDTSKVARVGVIPRYAEDQGEMMWIDMPGFNPVHCVNAWDGNEDENEIVMVASNALAVDQVVESIDCAEMRMEMIAINVKERTVKRVTLSPLFLEFGVINPAYAAKRTRYIYAIIVETRRSLGVVKLDLSRHKEDDKDFTVASRLYGPGCHSGEPFFVAREPNNPTTEEDDGYLVIFTC